MVLHVVNSKLITYTLITHQLARKQGHNWINDSQIARQCFMTHESFLQRA